MATLPLSRADQPLSPVGLAGQLNARLAGTVSSKLGPVSAAAGVPANCWLAQYVVARPVNASPSGLSANDSS